MGVFEDSGIYMYRTQISTLLTLSKQNNNESERKYTGYHHDDCPKVYVWRVDLRILDDYLSSYEEQKEPRKYHTATHLLREYIRPDGVNLLVSDEFDDAQIRKQPGQFLHRKYDVV